ncbi:t-SNARE domain followed by hydrophobic stretch [Cryptosporidium ryanae]|uniref:t-SNARE domain followed by hydrophobic stretch n=1 Tax=Cryptosporidium ryanae TaxID=515981 RepID=UPI003519F976|nr:t-SNARE domain followed by hydrophobic stretch [Cryptosporidium ryanae]
MTFELSDFDNEEEMTNVSSEVYGEWDFSYNNRIAKLAKSVERNIFKLDDYISNNQKTSIIDVNQLEKVKLMINGIQNDVKKLDNLLREWKIELAGDPISYRDNRLELDSYINQQKIYLEKIDNLNRKINDLSTRVTFNNNSNSIAFVDQDDNNTCNEYSSNLKGLNNNNSVNCLNKINYLSSNKFTNIQINPMNEQELYGDNESSIHANSYNSNATVTSVEYQHRVYDQVDRQIAHETAIGLGQIQSQMHEANQIFKNLASMVNEQGETIQNLETTIDNTIYSSKKAVTELRKAYNSNSHRLSLFANYGLPAFLFMILVFILTLHFLNILF